MLINTGDDKYLSCHSQSQSRYISDANILSQALPSMHLVDCVNFSLVITSSASKKTLGNGSLQAKKQEHSNGRQP